MASDMALDMVTDEMALAQEPVSGARAAKRQKKIQQVVKQTYLKDMNVIEITYDDLGGAGCNGGCKRKGRSPRLYILPCPKTLACEYFANIFSNTTVDTEIDVYPRQQYYTQFCHKVCHRCLSRPDPSICTACGVEAPDFDISTSRIFNLSITQGPTIRRFADFHDLHRSLTLHLEGTQPRPPFTVFNCKFERNGLCEKQILKKFGIDTQMEVMISYSNIPSEVTHRSSGELPFWEEKRYQGTWQGVFGDDGLFPVVAENLLVLDGLGVIRRNVLDVDSLNFDEVVLIYVANMWQSEILYKTALSGANHYYETCPFLAKHNQKNPKRGRYKSVSHGFHAHGGPGSTGNLVRYCSSNLPPSEQESFYHLGDSIASSIWQNLGQFGVRVQQFFHGQASPVFIGMEGFPTKVQQMHFSKNSYIQPHVDKLDMEASFIAWFTRGNPSGGDFGVFQNCLKFHTDDGAGVFLRSKPYTHGTLKFDTGSLGLNDYKLGVALVNRQPLTTRVRNQLQEGTPLTWKNELLDPGSDVSD